jgi:hypothetical protein
LQAWKSIYLPDQIPFHRHCLPGPSKTPGQDPKQQHMTKQTKGKQVKKTKTPPENMDAINIQVNEFGQIVKNFDIDKINSFLNEHVPDKKLND